MQITQQTSLRLAHLPAVGYAFRACWTCEALAPGDGASLEKNCSMAGVTALSSLSMT